MLSFVLVSFKGNPTDDISLQKIFMQATCMVKDTFAAKEIEMDLQNGVCDDDFTIDVLVDPSSGEVVACVEYVYMRKYLWVECVAVKQTYQKAGIGSYCLSGLYG
jgi:hypothetical protein